MRAALQLQKTRGRIDNDFSSAEIDLLDDLFYCGNEILLGGSLHHIKVAALLRPDPGESAEPFALGIENVEPQHLVIVILSRLKRPQRRFGHAKD